MGVETRQRGGDGTTITGRRSTSPNLQNLPVRTEESNRLLRLILSMREKKL